MKKALLITFATIAGVTFLGWLIFGLWADILHIMGRGLLNHVWRGWLFPNGWKLWGATPLFWLIVVGVAMFVIHILYARKPNNGGFDAYVTLSVVILVANVVALIATIFMWGDWNARHYNASSVYVVEDKGRLPNSLTRVQNSKKAQIEIRGGAMPDSWEARTASATGAAYVLQKTGDSNVNTVLMQDTITYIYNGDGEGGSWTGIRNGTNRQPIYGVASWAGTGEIVKNCEFKGDNSLRRAFESYGGMNLSDDIAQFDPNFLYNTEDVYGYCDGDKPVIVIPGARVTGLQVQTALQSYGVLMVTGSPSGEPNIEFRDHVAPGELPGPVYPIKLTINQRDALSWSAGRVWPWQPAVGFETAGSAAQAGNNSDFLLRSKVDGRLYWVTPLKNRNTDSQTIVAYAMVAADEVNNGQLNQQRVYVMNDNDSRVVNFNDLENAVTQAVAKVDPGFFTGAEENHGKIVEFTPLGGGNWQVFAERGGRAVYQINVTGGVRMQTSVVDVVADPEDTMPQPTRESEGPSTDPLRDCNNPGQLSTPQIGECIHALADELTRRE